MRRSASRPRLVLWASGARAQSSSARLASWRALVTDDPRRGALSSLGVGPDPPARLLGLRQAHHELRSSTGCVQCRDLTLVSLDDLCDDGQAEACPGLASLASPLGTPEAVEQAPGVGAGRQAGPVVAHAQGDRVLILLERHLY